jgi:hypothetical protein
MSAPTQVWDIVPYLSGVPGPARLRRLVLALQVFIDDSGKDDPPVFVLAGFIAEAAQWAAFSDAWDAELKQSPAIEHFKMKDAHSLRGQFSRWSDLGRDHKVGRLSSLCE